MSIPAGRSGSKTMKCCAACGAMLDCTKKRLKLKAFTCQAEIVDIKGELPDCCWLNINKMSADTQAALMALPKILNRESNSNYLTRKKKHSEILQLYIKEVGAGEPTLQWYRDKLKIYTAHLLNGALSTLPYWKNKKLRFPSLSYVGSIDKNIELLRENTNDELADILCDYVERYYDLMDFGFKNDLYGKENPVKLSTLYGRIYNLTKYLDWLFEQGHASLQSAGRSVMDEYIAEKNIHTLVCYEISKLYKWFRKKHRFAPNIRFNRRGQGSQRNGFTVLKLNESRETYQRICAHPEPQGRSLALLALLYAQTIKNSIALKRSDLKRSSETGLWTISRQDLEPFAIEPELSEALDECLSLADSHTRKHGVKELEYIYPGRARGYISPSTAGQRIRAAAGVPGNILRRTAIVNMYRSGQKTMGTVVLRDILNVSSKTIQKAIRMTGDSVNTPTALEEADALRRAFLEDDDD